MRTVLISTVYFELQMCYWEDQKRNCTQLMQMLCSWLMTWASFFVKKITAIRFDLDFVPNKMPTELSVTETFTRRHFDQFDLLTSKSVEAYIAKAPSKSCENGPIPSSLVKECSNDLLPFLTSMVNLSVECREFPSVKVELSSCKQFPVAIETH